MADQLNQNIISCERCSRLRNYCRAIAKEKRKSFLSETYWGKPVPNFGDPKAQILIVGLAPAAHGGNRTGRMFTGDNSGVWLYRALHRAGFANEAALHQEPKVGNARDGLILKEVLITAVAHCAPPENKPLPQEIENCSEYLVDTIQSLPKLKVFVVLGQIAFKSLWRVLPDDVKPSRALPKFSHGGVVQLSDGRVIICSYHPSQQNTFTGKLTEPMFDHVFNLAKKIKTANLNS